MEKIKELWKNEYFKTLIMILIVILAFLTFWFGSKAIFKTDSPYLAVSSGSMIPTLNIGDLIVIQGGLNGSEIKAGYYNPNNSSEGGDIIVFHKPGNPSELIVHRVVRKYYDEKLKKWFFITKGDNNRSEDPWNPVPEDCVLGKVIFKVPYLGSVALFMQSTAGKVLLAVIIVITILWMFLSPEEKQEEAHEEQDLNVNYL